MSLRLKMKYNVSCDRDLVRRILKNIDPDAVSFRKHRRLKRRQYVSPGPNFCLHVDGYDKLKPWGFSIHGGICGFSRRLCWLRVGNTNKDPNIVAGYFIDYIKEVQGVPTRLRYDAGTENVTIEAIQIALRMNHTDKWAGYRSAHVGPSIRNQRIERYWGSYRQNQGQFWMTLFQDLEDADAYDKGNLLHRQALLFSFMELLQLDMEQARQDWNQHKIRQSKHSMLPSGKPDILFYCPETVNATSYLQHVNMEDVNEIEEEFIKRENKYGMQRDFLLLFEALMDENNREMPCSIHEGLDLYAFLVDALSDRQM